MTQSKDLDTSYRIAFPEDVARRMWSASSRARAAIVQMAAEQSRLLAVTVEVSLTGHDGKELADDDWIGIDHSGAFCHAGSAELAWRGTVRDFKALLKENL